MVCASVRVDIGVGSSKLHKVTVESILYKPGSLLGWIGGCEGGCVIWGDCCGKAPLICASMLFDCKPCARMTLHFFYILGVTYLVSCDM